MSKISMYRIAFEIDEPTKAQIIETQQIIRTSGDMKAAQQALTKLVAHLSQVGLYYFYHQSLKNINASYMQLQTVQLGLKAAIRGINTISSKILKALSHDQLLAIADFLDQITCQENS